jgi:hypothetical protein
MNKKQRVGSIFYDLPKVFDCVNHKILLDKLQFYGIESTFKTLIKSYLMGRHQRVVLGKINDNNNTSKWEIIKSGIPQGSILGPLFFLFYINDLPKIINKDNNMVFYADDTGIITTEKDNLNYEINLNQTFKDIMTRFNVNLLTLSFNKTQYLKF